MTYGNDLKAAVERALSGDWDGAHTIAQQYEGDAMADWLHAVLHRIEGDHDNSRYWYRRAGRSPDAFADAHTELAAIRGQLLQ